LLTQIYGGSWSDAGTIESLLTSSTHVSEYDPASTRVHEGAPQPERVAETGPERIRR
jgi:hypothetical protein